MKKSLQAFVLFILFVPLGLHAQIRNISGIITGKQDGLPLPGVSVMVKGTKVGTQTGPDGSYSIKVPPGSESLVFTFIGFTTQTITISSDRMNVTLSGAASELNEVQVVGYGTQTKRETVGNISTVKGADIIEQPVQNFVQSLAGRAPGVQITIPNGVLNTSPVFHIRGTNSISLSSQPLIVVDGIASFTGDYSGTSSAGNALANINPDDIESIDIAKDGAATAIYGSRGANGVVFVTTKKGKKGTTVVSLDSWFGLTQAYRLPKVLNAAQYIAEKNEALVNAGSYNTTVTSPQTIPLLYAGYSYDANGNPIETDWKKLIYRTGKSYNSSISISGGNDKTTFYGSATYGNQQGDIQKNSYINKALLFNVDHRANKYITIGVKLSYADQMNLASTSSGSLNGEAYSTAGLGREALLLPPNISPYNNDGSYNVTSGSAIGVGGNRGFSIGYSNPIPALDLDRSNNEINHATGNIYLQVKPLPWITLKTTYGLDYIYTFNDSFTNPISNYGTNGVNTGSAGNSYSSNKRYVWDNTAQFDYTFFQKHNFSLLLGNEQQATNVYGFGVNRQILSDPAFNVIQAGYSTTTWGGGSNTQNYLVSFFGRLNYNFDQKYYLSGTLRRDGYSGFGPNSKYGYFPGIGASWEITREKFWSNIKADKIFSSFKLRGSYAVTGNNNVGDFPSYTTYSTGLYNGTSTLLPNSNGNLNLAWEKSKKIDIGFNFGILNDRITGDVAVYKNNNEDLLYNVPAAPSAGLASNPLVNVASMTNKGLEIELNADIVRTKSFSWSSNFNISFNQNKVTALANGINSFTTSTSSLEIANITQVGASIGNLWIIRSAGVDPNNGRRIFINGQGKQVEYTYLGTQHWYYMDGSNAPAITQAADAVNYGTGTPKEIGGFNNSFRYKNFDLNVLFTYQLGFYVYYGTAATLTDQRFWNNSTDILDHWTTVGQIAQYPKVVFGDNVSNGTSFPTDFNTFSGQFVKLKTINFGYTLPKPILNKIGISSLRVYATAQNLFVITKYPGPDPEVSSNGTTNGAPGVDRNTAANARVFTAGFSVKF